MPLHIDNDKFILDEKQLPKAREAFIKFYKTSERAYVEKRVAHFAEMVGRTPSVISIRELGAHWASCTPQQKINFHWKCIMAPPKVIDYLIVHELTHLNVLNTPASSGMPFTACCPTTGMRRLATRLRRDVEHIDEKRDVVTTPRTH